LTFATAKAKPARFSVATTVCYGTVGATIGVLIRSTSAALGLGIAWLGPVEHITQLTWSDAERWSPGLLFDTLAVGGTALVPYQRALLVTVVGTALALTVGEISFLRRDVSA
jgi:ABC-2 type transport system permease protein